MKNLFAALLAALSMVTASAASADTAGEIRAVYEEFRSAQNACDLTKVKALLLDSPEFLWVSDGKSFWGPDALVRRMAEFQLAEVWRVDPEFDKAAIVKVDEQTAYLHMPLALTIGPKAKPDVIRFLVSILCVKKSEGWRIAALFTTNDKAN